MSPSSGRVAAALLTALAIASAVAAQPRGSDLLDQYKNRTAVEAQRIENEVRDAVVGAMKAAAVDPAVAVTMLKDAAAKVEASEALTATRRDALIRDLRERVRLVEADARRSAATAEEDARRKAQAAINKADQNRELADQEKITRSLDQIKTLRDAGRNEEASRVAADLNKQFPDNPAVLLAGRTSVTSDRLNEYYRVLNDRERRLLAARLDVDRSATPPAGDIEFPSAAKWAEITKLRKNTQPLTEKEKSLLNALNTPVTMDVKNGKLEEVLDYLNDKLGLEVIVDKASLDQLMLTYDTPVSIRANKMSARTVLRKILADLGLSFVVKDQVIQAMTPDRARGLLTTRVYYVGDLIGVYDFNLPPALNQIQMAQNVAGLLDYITRNVDPDSWAVNDRGGIGSLAFDPIRGSIVVKQSAEVHYFLGAGLR